jgi:hypothetical protein
MVQRELGDWFGALSPDGKPRIDWLANDERGAARVELHGKRGYFTDANGCIARAAWEQAPFRDVPYAEDHALAHDMMRAGFAKVFMPEAAVIHSHDYPSWGWLRRSFDEARAMRSIYGWREPRALRMVALNVWGSVGADWRWAREQPGARSTPRGALSVLTRSTVHHAARATGGALGDRADRLAPAVARRLSLERRSG